MSGGSHYSRFFPASGVSAFRVVAVVVFCVSAVLVMAGCGGGGGPAGGYGSLEGWVCYDSSAKAVARSGGTGSPGTGSAGAGSASNAPAGGALAGSGSRGVMKVFAAEPRGTWVALEGATVTIGSRSDVTDSDGYFFIGSIRAGTYTVTISHPRFMPVSLQVTIRRDQTTNLGSEVMGAFYYILVGINDYHLYTPRISNLNYCVADAMGIYNKLTNDAGSHNWLKGYTPTVLTDLAATWSAIQNAFTALQSQMRRQDYLVFYFSGHGGQLNADLSPVDEEDGKDEVICACDTYVLDDELASWAANLSAAVGAPPEHFVFLFDSCSSGGMAKVKARAPNSLARTASEVTLELGKGVERMAKDLAANGYSVLAACRDAQSSFEGSDVGHGYFTYYILDGLTWTSSGGGHLKADAAPYDDIVTTLELFDYVSLKLSEASLPESQNPVLEPQDCTTPLFALVP